MTIYLHHNVTRARALEAVEAWARAHPDAVILSVEIREDFTVVIRLRVDSGGLYNG